MRTIEKIRKYILREKKRGHLKPGDRIPSYHELMKMLGGSFATVQAAMKKLAAEGLVEIKNGLGVYLSGASPLKIKLFMGSGHMDMSAMQEMIMRRVKAQNLYLDVELFDRESLHNDKVQEYKHLGGNEKVYIVETSPGQNFSISGLANLQGFEGFDEMVDDIIDEPIMDKTVSLPFYAINHQIGMNLRLLSKAGVNPKIISGEDFSWHERVFMKCRERSVVPAVSYWSAYDTWWIAFMDFLLCSMLLKEKNILPPYDSKPVYYTESGREAFKILSGFDWEYDKKNKSKLFMYGGAAISFDEGSWFAVHCSERSSEPVENFRLLPYTANGRKINYLSIACLQTYLAGNLTPDEKNRVFALLQILVSKEFQIEYCGKTGFLSVRKDMSATDYSWNTRPDFAAFVPGENEINIWGQQFMPTKFRSAVSSYFDLYKFHGADLELMLKCLDEKVVPESASQ